MQKVRALGGMTFIDLRDRYGITQIVVEEAPTRRLVLRPRRWDVNLSFGSRGVSSSESKNMKMSTGEIEIVASSIKVLNAAETPPFTIEENSDGGDDLRMKYRYSIYAALFSVP